MQSRHRPSTWGGLQGDLLEIIARQLPVRLRYGSLPLVNKHFYAASNNWTTRDVGIYELFMPSTPLSTQGIERRCANLLAWLDQRASQLSLLHCDLPKRWRALLSQTSVINAEDRHALDLAIQAGVEEALWKHRAAFDTLILYGSNLSKALAVPVGDRLASCKTLSHLELWDYEGSAADIAALLLAPQGPKPPELQLVFTKSKVPPTLLSKASPVVLSALVSLQGSLCPYYGQEELCGELLACTSLTQLEISVPDSWQPPEGLAALRHLAHLTIKSSWTEVPGELARLPLTSLSLRSCSFSSKTAQQRRRGGLPPDFALLAPTLRALHFIRCCLTGVPIVVSELTNLSCLSLENEAYNNVLATLDHPPLSTFIAGLETLHANGVSATPAVLNKLPRLQSLALACKPGRGQYLSRLTSLTLQPPVWSPFVDLQTIGGATGLRHLEINAVDYEDDMPEVLPSRIRSAQALNGLPGLTGLILNDVGGNILPPEDNYLSSLRSLEIRGYHNATLAPGLSAATGLTALSIDNFRMSVDMVWEQLASLVPRSPFLKEVLLYEHEDLEIPATSMLVGDLLEDMRA